MQKSDSALDSDQTYAGLPRSMRSLLHLTPRPVRSIHRSGLTSPRLLATPFIVCSVATGHAVATDSYPCSLASFAFQTQDRANNMYHMNLDPFDRLLAGMLPFHQSFRQKHAALMQRLPATQSMSRLELLSYFQLALSLAGHLEAHHRIEEAYIFPLLAPKLPQFGKEHLKEHTTMHVAVEELEKYSSACSKELRSLKENKENDAEWPKGVYDEDKMKSILEHLRDTLFVHLAHEEDSLKAETLKKAGFTEKDLATIPI
ncbi:hypothetical protein K437DRAFT_254712 [Tilletiaria anomala UBC 951]|uniref:Hemerythrin-like domain-containing protein n=1 Tax=Tilletiaria anomala (strain ATCC 24038 / CBS 436.72 / UBC 951) TaxID=1037660 RepID=A0A066WE00_TILAU|nr:uncharacterized protein K437DRAFT_254712 [Tilletiaria anomala UBC 951]KDN51976.1 hypothetical protein K437DRAFT_254712 [Tilletiaria anomala UBC 951]